MSAQYSAFARPNLDASFFDREEPQTDAAPMFATPVYAQRTPAKSTTKGTGMNPAWVAVPVVIAAVGAGAYFMISRDAEPNVASTKPVPAAMAPVVTPAPQVATNTIEPVTPATAVASTSGRIMTSQPSPVRVARAQPAPRQAASASAADASGVDTSATLPASPQAYSGSAAPAAEAPAPMITPPSAATAVEPVNPTPQTVTPEAATPPIAPQVPDSPTSPPTN